jgi:hypothetical protein
MLADARGGPYGVLVSIPPDAHHERHCDQPTNYAARHAVLDNLDAASDRPIASTATLESSDPADGRPLIAHPLIHVVPQLVPAISQLRELLLRFEHKRTELALCRTDLHPEHIRVDVDQLGGVIDFGDDGIVPPAFDIASFAYSFGWQSTEALIQGCPATASSATSAAPRPSILPSPACFTRSRSTLFASPTKNVSPPHRHSSRRPSPSRPVDRPD